MCNRTLMQDELVIADPKAAEALLDPFRYRLFRLLEQPKTVPELAEQLGSPANRLYYHVRRLAKHGLIEQVDARARGKHTERVYGIAAKRISVSDELEHPPIVAARVSSVLREVFDEVADAIERARATRNEEPGLFSWLIGRLTTERAREFEQRFQELLNEFADEEPGDDATPYGILAAVTPLPQRDGA